MTKHPGKLASVRGRAADVFLGLLGAQALLRIVMLATICNLGRLSLVAHGTGLALLAGCGGLALMAARRNALLRALVAMLLAAVVIGLTAFDLATIVVARVWGGSPPLDTLTGHFCEGRRWFSCALSHRDITIELSAIFAGVTGLFLFSAARIADRVESLFIAVDRWMKPRLAVSSRKLLATVGGLYLLAWACASGLMVQREPLTFFLNTKPSPAGPIELTEAEYRPFKIVPSPSIKPKTLVVITIDSLRADHVELRAGRPSLMPFLQSLAARGQLRDIGPAVAACPQSYCGIIAIQASSTWAGMQRGYALMLGDVLAANGYRNYFILGGEHQTFENLGRLYGPNFAVKTEDRRDFWRGSYSDDRVVIRDLARTTFDGPQHSYVNIHLMSSHAAGLRFEPGRQGGANQLLQAMRVTNYRTFYESGVRQTDDIVRQIFDILRRKRLLDNAVVVITSDHGERINVAGKYGHYGNPDRHTVPIPLLLYETHPSPIAPRGVVSQIDIAPTLLDMIKVARPAAWQGQSLLRPPLVDAAASDSRDEAAMVGTLPGGRYLLRCEVDSGRTFVERYDGRPLAAGEAGAALAQAPSLYAHLLRRGDGEKCFTPPAAAPPRS